MSQIKQAKIAAISASSAGDNTIVAAVAARSIKVWQLWITAADAVTFTFKDGAATSLSGAGRLVADGSAVVLDYTGMPWAVTIPGNAFIISLGGAIAITGAVFYTVE